MNSLTIIKSNGQFAIDSREVAEMTGMEFQKPYLDYIDMYEVVSKLSFRVSEIGLQKLLDLVDVAKSLIPSENSLPFLDHSVRHLIFSNWNNCLPNELDIHKDFKKVVNKIIPNCNVAKKKSNPKHQPDCWVRIINDYLPVEIKLNDFDIKALDQLQRYISFYNSKSGIAVGKTLKTILPNNIVFISIAQVKEALDNE